MASRAIHLLVCDSDVSARSELADYFTAVGFHVVEAGDAQQCRSRLASGAVDFLLLSTGLPDEDGLEVGRKVRSDHPELPFIFLTPTDSELDRVVGLEIGADDSVTKRIGLRELHARIKSVMRRAGTSSQPDTSRHDLRTLGGWTVDLTRREVTAESGELVDLTRAEFDLLAALLHHSDRVVSRDYLLDVASNRRGSVTERTVDTLVSRLRKKMESAGLNRRMIETAYGVGYRLSSDNENRA
ncbi:MAG: response regulator transcription factor [Alphaproteobacteria bacterium]|nr:response regulator transcription factor [Alphaproteobacteria bacterium]